MAASPRFKRLIIASPLQTITKQLSTSSLAAGNLFELQQITSSFLLAMTYPHASEKELLQGRYN